jgi:predicted dehydrogenase
MTGKCDIPIVMIGCGAFARRYHVPAIERDGAARIAAIVDPSPAPATRALAEATSAPLVARIADAPELIGAMAIVSTPHTLHAQHVREALARGWHVLCDKPFVMKAAEARDLAAEARRRELVNAVAYNRRFDRGYLAARAAIAAGRIGEVRYVETVQLGYERAGWFLDPALGGGGPYTGRASHMADIVPWLIRRVPNALRSRLRGDGGARTDRGGFIEMRFGDLECRMTCIEEGFHMWDEVRVFGEDGLIELRRPLTLPIGWELTLLADRGRARETIEADATPGAATDDFLSALRGGPPVACDFARAVPSVAIVEAAFASARSGEPWLELDTA